MRYVALLIAIAGGFGLGWLVRDRTVDAPTVRGYADRTVAEETRRRIRAEQVAREAKAAQEATRAEITALRRRIEAAPAESAKEEETAAGTITGFDKEELDKMIKGMATQWRGFATVSAKRGLAALLAELGFDEATAKRIEAAVESDVERAMESTAYAMFGEGEMDPNAFFYFMGLPPELSSDLEAELATFLDDAAIGDVRDGFKKQNKKAVDDMANMQISMMAIPDLSEDQRTQLKEVFTGKNVWQDQMSRFSEATRDKAKFAALIDGKADLDKEIRAGMAPQRDRMRTILTPEQFKRYEAYETQMVAQAQMGIKMMQSMFKSTK